MDVRIHDLLARLAAVSPQRVGATLGDDVRTFGQLDAGANRAAHRLIAEGVERHDRVVWWGPTVLDALELAYGISKAGGTLAPINPNFSEAEATDALQTLAVSDCEGGGVYGVVFRGRRYDTGDKLSYLKAVISIAADRVEFGEELRAWMKAFVS